MNTVRLQKVVGLPDGFHLDSGPVQFGEDWPGVFFRGDTACNIGYMLASFVALGLDAGKTSAQDFALYGFLVKHAEKLASCDLSGVVLAQVQAVRDRVHADAALADAPAAGGVQ